ncbi:entericidin A/B family lipoprotein [Rhodovulum sulfidophilum]|uniref:Entericidin A/B family lipoprotein n=1 Tax=Rhodovulum sulfidophilum TaxID=35806 RepID=A0ABS1RT34_RHOSU|nr:MULTISPECIES: entericidin A/B family lipoprotein [Rhodovulum]ARC89816.1 entericidin EcnAB [Rhodovulum sp. MB263]MBL3553528.1 entericidin A/B family lipoprotein [Rhodovulum sulfidophilum]MBL3564218.1 entericidin A/B family lipoprotein [Rhodovulum sulfidophilum]MBL3595205.1 entericidin A/B family lipoprotein [Rhodovulum sulfidophilum]MBL3609244.1 entericidin A/B family lipoprotein [Rhodovulum sulfidophilum]
MTRIVVFCLSAAALLGVAACETVEGAGKDIQSAGGAISQEAREAQN